MILERVISGGQSGADQAAWRAAKAAGIACGGTMPLGFLTEEGDRPDFAEAFGAVEHPSRKYPPRTRANVADSDGTLWFGEIASRGYACTHDAAMKRSLSYPFFIVYRGTRPAEVVEWVRTHGIRVLNVAGNRASTDPELGPRVEAFLGRVFRIIKGGSEA